MVREAHLSDSVRDVHEASVVDQNVDAGEPVPDLHSTPLHRCETIDCVIVSHLLCYGYRTEAGVPREVQVNDRDIRVARRALNLLHRLFSRLPRTTREDERSAHTSERDRSSPACAY